jgi:signal transduction histidine kinase
MPAMSVLMFLGRWAWIAVIAASLLIGAYLFRTINDFEDSARLVSDVGELRGYQETMLQTQIASAMLGVPATASLDEVLGEAERRATALVARIDPDRHDCDGTCTRETHDPTHNHRIAESIEAVVRDLQALATLSEDATADYVEELQQNQLFALSSTDVTLDLAGTGGSSGDDVSGLEIAVMGVRYATLSGSITANLDDATNALADDGREAAGRVQRAGRIGIATLLVGGLVSTTGFAWSGRRTRKLSWDIERAQEMNALKSEFVALASHELRTPLAGIYGFSELLLADETLPAQSQGWAKRINEESRRLAEIVESLLSLSRIEAGKIEVDLVPVEMRPAVEAVVAMFEGDRVDHPITIDGDLDVTVGADAALLVQVLSNVVDNAVKYSPDGGAIQIEGVLVDDGLELRISDHGIGIGTEDLPLIFERFHRGARPGLESVRSTGLGLYLVKELTELMGGSVAARSELDVGTTIAVTLPLRDEQ